MVGMSLIPPPMIPRSELGPARGPIPGLTPLPILPPGLAVAIMRAAAAPGIAGPAPQVVGPGPGQRADRPAQAPLGVRPRPLAGEPPERDLPAPREPRPVETDADQVAHRATGLDLGAVVRWIGGIATAVGQATRQPALLIGGTALQRIAPARPTIAAPTVPGPATTAPAAVTGALTGAGRPAAPQPVAHPAATPPERAEPPERLSRERERELVEFARERIIGGATRDERDAARAELLAQVRREFGLD